MNNRSSQLALAVALLAMLAAVGCEDEKPIRSYTIAKDEPPPPPTRPAQAGGDIEWTLPGGWRAFPGNDGITHTTITSDGENPIRITVTRLPGGAGGVFANIERWAGQIDFKPDDNDPEPVVEPRQSRSGQYLLVDMKGRKLDEETGKPLRILGAVLNADQSVWFVKAMGPSDQLQPHKPAFTQLTDSIKLPGVAPGAQAGREQPPASTGPPPSIAAPAPPDEDLKPPGAPDWTVPQGWQPGPQTAFALASFVVSDESGSAKTTVSQLGMPPGDSVEEYLLINVNRWRRQVGLPSAESVAAAGVNESQLGGLTAYAVDLVADTDKPDAPRILGVIIPRGGQAWFVKMTGPNALVGTQKDAFTQFVQSIEF